MKKKRLKVINQEIKEIHKTALSRELYSGELTRLVDLLQERKILKVMVT